MESTGVFKILEKYDNKGDNLVAILEDIQSKYGYLPKDILGSVAEETGRPLVDIYGVATFYKSFSLKPRGESNINSRRNAGQAK